MSSFAYISYPIETSPQDLLDEMISYVKSNAPAWVENDANLDTWIMQIVSSQAADLRTLASDVPDTIFRYFGSSLIGLAPIDATQARLDSTWTMTDDSGYMIPDGTFVTLRSAEGEDIAFQTVGDVIVPSGDTATADGGVPLVAVQAGLAGSGLGGVGVAATLLDTLDFVLSVVTTDISTGGVDAETSTEYMDRLVRRLRRLSTRPILPDDFANMALDVVGIYRAVAIDGYDPSDDTSGHERTIALAGVDELGNDLDGAHKADLAALIAANREATFVVNIMDANRTSIDVDFDAIAVLGFDAATVQANAIAAIENYLNPANWGHDPRFTDSAALQTWVQIDKVYYFEMAQLISNIEGIDRITALTINKTGDAPGVIDVDLVTPATLTEVGTITGTVTAP
jgi:hypothetical protein